MSIIKEIKNEPLRSNSNITPPNGKMLITLTIVIDQQKYKGSAVTLYIPKLYNAQNEELPLSNPFAFQDGHPQTCALHSLKYTYSLGDIDSSLEDGSKFIIQYRCEKENRYIEETYIWKNPEWHLES